MSENWTHVSCVPRESKKNNAKKLEQGTVLRSKTEPSNATADKNKKTQKNVKKDKINKKSKENQKTLKSVFEISIATGNKYFVQTTIFGRKC